MKRIVIACCSAVCGIAFAAGLSFPDGSVVNEDKLPGFLISNNGGVYGKYQRPVAMKFGFGNSLVDGEIRGGLLVWADRGTKKYPVEFPDTATLQEIQVVYSAEKESQLTLFVSDDGKAWKTHHVCALPVAEKKFLRIPINPVKSRFFAFGNAGKIKYRLMEVWFWGKGKEIELAKTSGILPEMKTLGSSRVALPVLDKPLTANNFTPDALKGFRKFELVPFRQTKTTDQASLFAAMTPQGAVFVHRRNNPELRLSHYEISCNRTDFIATRYYHFIGYSSGKCKTDASRVIDPTESGKPFQCSSFRKKIGEIYYDIMILPLDTMTRNSNFKDYQWAFSFVGLYRDKNKKPVRLTFPALRSLHAPMQFGVMEAARTDGEKFSFFSFEGMERTSFTQTRFNDWRSNPAVKGKSLVISNVNLENGALTHPVLPVKDLNQNVALQMTANEIENLFFFVINPQDKKNNFNCSFDGFRDAAGKPVAGLSAEIGIVGVTPLRSGTALRPIFTPDNMPGKVFFNKYIRNAASIQNFPEVSLVPGEAAALALRIRSNGAKGGKYQGVFNIGGEKITVTLNVTGISLTRPQELWNNGHARLSHPELLIKGNDYAAREAQYYYDCGVNVFPINPLKNPAGVDALKKRIPNLLFYFRNNAPFNRELLYGKINPQTWTPEKKADIVRQVLELRDGMLKAGYSRKQFFISLKDEPSVDNTAWGYGKIVEALKKADPALQLYCNPCCWVSGGFAATADILKAYSSWYHLVDISYPIDGLYFGWGTQDMKPLQKLWNAPRRFNGTYIHPFPGRIQPWKAFFAGLNAWGYYSMYQPMGDAWNDFDKSSMDYQTLYPGVNAPIYTLQSEQTREAWEDYLMLLALKAKPAGAELLKKLEKSLKDVSVFPPRGIQSPWDARREALIEALKR